MYDNLHKTLRHKLVTSIRLYLISFPYQYAYKGLYKAALTILFDNKLILGDHMLISDKRNQTISDKYFQLQFVS